MLPEVGPTMLQIQSPGARLGCSSFNIQMLAPSATYRREPESDMDVAGWRKIPAGIVHAQLQHGLVCSSAR